MQPQSLARDPSSISEKICRISLCAHQSGHRRGANIHVAPMSYFSFHLATASALRLPTSREYQHLSVATTWAHASACADSPGRVAMDTSLSPAGRDFLISFLKLGNHRTAERTFARTPFSLRAIPAQTLAQHCNTVPSRASAPAHRMRAARCKS